MFEKFAAAAMGFLLLCNCGGVSPEQKQRDEASRARREQEKKAELEMGKDLLAKLDQYSSLKAPMLKGEKPYSPGQTISIKRMFSEKFEIEGWKTNQEGKFERCLNDCNDDQVVSQSFIAEPGKENAVLFRVDCQKGPELKNVGANISGLEGADFAIFASKCLVESIDLKNNLTIGSKTIVVDKLETKVGQKLGSEVIKVGPKLEYVVNPRKKIFDTYIDLRR